MASVDVFFFLVKLLSLILFNLSRNRSVLSEVWLNSCKLFSNRNLLQKKVFIIQNSLALSKLLLWQLRSNTISQFYSIFLHFFSRQICCNQFLDKFKHVFSFNLQWKVIRTSAYFRISCTIIMTGIRWTASSPCMSTSEATVWGCATIRGWPQFTNQLIPATSNPMPPAIELSLVASTRPWPASWLTSRPAGK